MKPVAESIEAPSDRVVEATSRRKRRRRWKIPALIVLVGVIVAYTAASSYIKRRLEASVAKKIDGELHLRRFFYVPPYGVWIGSAHLTRGENVVIDFGNVSLKLAKLPFGGGPVLIERFIIRDPVVKLSRGADGTFGFKSPYPDPAGQPPETKPSDLLRLRKFRIDRGRVEFVDHVSVGHVSGGRVPSVWRDIDVDIDTAPTTGPAAYEFAFTARNGNLAELKASGDADIDEAIVDVENLALRIVAQPDAPDSPLPGEVQDLLRDYKVKGSLAFTGRGHVPLRELSASAYIASLELNDAAIHLPKWDVTVQPVRAKFTMRGEPRPTTRAASASTAPSTQPAPGPALDVVVDTFHAGSGGASLNLIGGKLAIDPAAQTWRVTGVAGFADFDGPPPPAREKVYDALERFNLAGSIDFTAAADGPTRPGTRRRLHRIINHEILLYPRALDVQPAKFPHVLSDIGGGSVRVAGGFITAENLSARYGKDRWLLNNARLAVDELPRVVRATDIDGSIEFVQPSQEYPKGLAKTVAALNPAGPFFVGGTYALDLDAPRNAEGKRVPEMDLMITSDAGAFAVTKHRIPITNIRGDALLRYGTLEVRTFDGDVLGGTIAARAAFKTTKPRGYEGKASLREIDLEQLGRAYVIAEEPDRKLSGRGFANLALSGSLEPGERKTALAGDGAVEIIDGELFEVPVLRDIVQLIGLRKDAATAGYAEATFDFKGDTVHVRNAAVCSPVVGLQGGGRVGTDGTLDLDIVVAPLADWREKLKSTNIPIVSDVTGELAGAIQRMLNAATRGLLYEFRVNGKADGPQISAVPAPVLDEARAVIFGEMLGESKRERRMKESVPRRGEKQ